MKNRNNFQSKKRCWLATLVLIVVGSLFLSSCETEEPKAYQVGVLAGAEAFAATVDSFKTQMVELGYIEGQNINYDVYLLNDEPAKEQEVVNKFVVEKVDLIFVFPVEAALKAKTATQGTGIPVVFAWSSTERTRIIESVRMPGGNITGVRLSINDLLVKRLELLLELVPSAKRIWVPYDPRISDGTIATVFELMNPIASNAGVKLIKTEITSLKDFKAELQKIETEEDPGFDAIMLMPEAIITSKKGWALMSKFAGKHKIPVAAQANWQVYTGAIFSFSPDNIRAGKLAADLADKVLKGTPAGTIPVVTIDGSLLINYKVAQEMGLTVPNDLLYLATEIIR